MILEKVQVQVLEQVLEQVHVIVLVAIGIDLALELELDLDPDLDVAAISALAEPFALLYLSIQAYYALCSLLSAFCDSRYSIDLRLALTTRRMNLMKLYTTSTIVYGARESGASRRPPSITEQKNEEKLWLDRRTSCKRPESISIFSTFDF